MGFVILALSPHFRPLPRLPCQGSDKVQLEKFGSEPRYHTGMLTVYRTDSNPRRVTTEGTPCIRNDKLRREGKRSAGMGYDRLRLEPPGPASYILNPCAQPSLPQRPNGDDAPLLLYRCLQPGRCPTFSHTPHPSSSSLQFTHYSFNRHEPKTPQPVLITTLVVPTFWSTILLQSFASPLSAISFSFITYFAVLSISIAAYRLSPFHPLASFPGTTLCKLTKWWGVWETYNGKRHLRVHELHKNYGPIVRVGPNELSVADATAIPTVLGSGGLPKGHCMPRFISFPQLLKLIGLCFS